MKHQDELKELHGHEYVENYDKSHTIYRLERLFKYVHLQSDYNVADFGCGSGMLMEFVASKVKSYVGVDFSIPFIEAANRKKIRLGIKNAVFYHSSINEYCQQNIG